MIPLPRTVLLFGVLAAGIGGVACGAPNPPGPPPSPTAALRPCDMIPASAATQFGLTAPAPAGNRACGWRDAAGGYTVTVSVRDSQGITDIDVGGYTVTPDRVGRHSGVEAQMDTGGGCFVAVGVGDAARVDVLVHAGTDGDRACVLANRLAATIEPGLRGADTHK
jgi:hypothetical protein